MDGLTSVRGCHVSLMIFPSSSSEFGQILGPHLSLDPPQIPVCQSLKNFMWILPLFTPIGCQMGEQILLKGKLPTSDDGELLGA